MIATATGGAPAQSAGITALALNVTATNPTAASYLTVTPAGAPLGSSNLNWVHGETVPNSVITKVRDSDGRIVLTNKFGSVDVITDSSGFWDAGGDPTGLRFRPLPPNRLADTRVGFLAPGSALGGAGRVDPDGFISFKANGGLPPGARAVVVNITAVAPDAPGFLSAFPLGMDYDEGMSTSVVNFTAGAVRPNMAILPLGAGGEIIVANGSQGAVDMIVDITGYFL